MKYWPEIFSVVLGVSILIFSNLYVSHYFPFLVPILNVLGGLIACVPPVFILYGKYKVNKEIEEQFIVFLQDLTDSINSGMTLPLALNHCARRNYLSLSKYINEISSQVDWGIPFEKALKNFANKIESVPVKRAVFTIVETYKVGGNLSDTLGAISKSLITIEKIKKERAASVRSQILTTYMIYFVFIFILIIMQVFLIPSLSQRPSGLSTEIIPSTPILPETFKWVFTTFIIIQGFFAGLVTGKMSEGSLINGLKHSVILTLVGYSVFSFASQFSFGFGYS